MKNFDNNRFLQTLKWNIITEKKTLFAHSLAFVAAFLLIQLFYICVMNMLQEPGPKSVIVAMTFSASIVGFLTSYYASGILGNARTKEQRTTVLMLPASNAEKYCARLVYVLVIIPLFVAAALIVATLLRMGIQLLLGHDYIVFGFDMLFDESGFEFLETVLAHVFMMSLFVLGGALFRKHPFIWTWVSLMVLILSLALVVGLLVKLLNPTMHHFYIHMDIPRVVGDVLFTALTVFNFWLSYRLFCRLQIVQHKWFNL